MNKLCPGSGQGSLTLKNGKCPYCKKTVAVQGKDVAAGGSRASGGNSWPGGVIQLHYK